LPQVERCPISRELRETLKAAKIPHQELARVAGVTASAVQQWLSGKVWVRRGDPRVIRLGTLIDVPPERCFGDFALRYYVGMRRCIQEEIPQYRPVEPKNAYGLCDPRCPAGCRWREGDRCRKYRGFKNLTYFRKQVDFSLCREVAIPSNQKSMLSALSPKAHRT